MSLCATLAEFALGPSLDAESPPRCAARRTLPIELEVYDFNPRAQRVYEKCGFTVEGRARDALLWDGGWHDAVLMSIVSGDPRPWRDGRT